MLRKFGRSIAIVYVALALSPLVVIALYYPVLLIWRLFDMSDVYTRDAVTSPERAAELAKKGLIEQLVTFPEEPIGLRKDPQSGRFDLYAIAVSQTTLPEEITPITMFRKDPLPPLPEMPTSSLKYASSNPVVGQFNNVILFEPNTGKLTAVFSTRLAVSEFKFASGPGFEVLMVLATDTDSNKDGSLSGLDRQDLYIYSIPDATLHKVTGLGGHPGTIVDMPGQGFVVVRTVLDIDSNGVTTEDAFSSDVPEPIRLYRVDLRTYVAEPMIPSEMLDTLQKTLDGRMSEAIPAP